jgi:ElaB/YqjD/DUF883 family membrane-anchored ribosome-binding protein
MMEESRRTGTYGEGVEERERPYITGDGNIRNVVADKLHAVAQTIFRKAQETNPDVASYGREASAVLEQSANYVRDFDYGKAEVAVRDYVKKNPGRSLLIAGLGGLVIGAILRRR